MLQVPDKSLKLDQRAFPDYAVLYPYIVVIKDCFVINVPSTEYTQTTLFS